MSGPRKKPQRIRWWPLPMHCRVNWCRRQISGLACAAPGLCLRMTWDCARLWLRSGWRILGFETYVVEVSDALRAIPKIAKPVRPDATKEICAAQSALDAHLSGQGVFLDVRSSDAYSKGHVAGATWVNRANLSKLPLGPQYFLIEDDGPRATLAALELKRLGHDRISIVEGGHRTLEQAGATLETRPPYAAVAGDRRDKLCPWSPRWGPEGFAALS